ncbi:MAG: hypothetical protein WCF94_00475 [bacterium]
MLNNTKNNQRKGAIVILAVLFFLIVGLIVVTGLSYVVTKDFRNTSNMLFSKNSFYASESGVEDVLYRMKKSQPYSDTEVLSVDGSYATTTSVDSGSTRTITAEGLVSNFYKKIKTIIKQGEGADFSYGVQIGNGGLTITGGSAINGNVYSNGSIKGGSGIHIYGSAVAASSGGLIKDTTNETPTTPPNSISFNTSKTLRDFAQSFTVATTSSISKISIYVKKVGAPGSFTATLRLDDAGAPDTVGFSSATLASTLVTTNYGWVDLTFSPIVTLTAGQTYWLIIQGTTNSASSNYYVVGANSAYANGQAKIGNISTSAWSATTPAGLDGYFTVYLGSTASEINGYEGDYLNVGSKATDIAWASNIKHISATGKLYCATATNISGSKTCDAGSSGMGLPPPSVGVPISEANIDAWHAEAEAGGTFVGTKTYNSTGGTLGPKVITGNLNLGGGGTLTLTGTVWVKGVVVVSGGGKIVLSSSYGSASGVIIADGYVSVAGGGAFSGSGTAGSYPVIVTTSKCPLDFVCNSDSQSSALMLSGGAGAVVLAAPNGMVHINGGSGCKSVYGDSVYIDGGGNVNYETGIANMQFKSGPTGGWTVDSWGEAE